jgi:hypothetical protein
MEKNKHNTNMKIKRGTIGEDGMIFWKNDSRYKDGQYWITKEKFEQWTNREKNKSLEYALNNREKAKIKSKQWRKENKEKHRKYSLNWQKQNPNRVNKKNKKWKQNNLEKYKQIQKNYSKSVPEKKQKNAANRRCRKKTQSVFLTEGQKKIIECFYKQSLRLKKRFGIEFEVDHIIPISKGGLHHPSNLQVLPLKINRIKGCKEVFRWQDYQSPFSSDE